MTDPISSKRLWQSVVMIAIRDLCNDHPCKQLNRKGAENWVGPYPDADFREVCHLAGFEVRRVHTVLSRLCELAPADRRELLNTFTPLPRNKRAA